MSNVHDHILHLRKEYSHAVLTEQECGSDPIAFFEHWISEAIKAQVHEPNAMALSTVDQNGFPHSRIVLLRGLNAEGFRFFTSYDSDKGKQLGENPNACLLFFWPELERQVRIEGVVTKASTKESDDYFHSRPYGNRLGAWASPQSQVIPNRKELEKKLEVFKVRFGEGNAIHRPENWGGYRLKPTSIEFWQGRESRLHDRVRFRLDSNDHAWIVERLAP